MVAPKGCMVNLSLWVGNSVCASKGAPWQRSLQLCIIWYWLSYLFAVSGPEMAEALTPDVLKILVRLRWLLMHWCCWPHQLRQLANQQHTTWRKLLCMCLFDAETTLQ